jgi:hypothetical protein
MTISGTPQATAAVAASRHVSRPASARSALAPAASTTSNIQVSVADATGATASLTFGVAVSPPPALAITTTSLAAGTAGTAYSASVTATGGVTPYTWTATGLPSGLSFSSGTPSATISGTTDNVGTFSVQVTVTDSESPTVSTSATFSLTIAQAAALTITTTSLAAGTAGTAYTASVTATGGATPYTWTATGLPSGLSFSSGTPSATISGTTDDVGTFSVKVTVTDSESPTMSTSATLSLTIAQAAALAIATTSLPNGTENISYSQPLSATGGVKPYTWTLTSGSLPTGLLLSTAGVISGTPTAAGSFSFVVQVTDTEVPAQTATIGLGITINTTTSGLNITTTSPLPGATQNSAYTTTVTASGGTPPYTWTLGSGSTLPAGLSLTSGTPSATIAGTPTATGTFRFTLDVKDSASTPATASASFLLTVTGSSSFTCPTTFNPLQSLCGTNIVEVSGSSGSSTATAFFAVFLADNSGNVVSGEKFGNDTASGPGTVTITGGNYTMDTTGDGRGVLTIIDSTATSATFRFVNHTATNYKTGAIEEFDSTGTLASGVIATEPTTSALLPIPANTVVGAQLVGVNGAGQRVALLGSFEVGSNGCDGTNGSFNSMTGENIVVNSGGTVTTGLTATGSCSPPDALGVGSAQITLSGGTPFTNNALNFMYFEYTTSGTGGGLQLAFFLSSDTVGTNQPIMAGPVLPNSVPGKVTNALFASTCGGSSACVATEDGVTSSGGTIHALVRFVVTAGSGNTGTLSGKVDENAAGTITTNGTWPYTSYTIDSNGSGTFTGSGQKAIHVVYTDEGPYTLDESAQVRTGNFNQQNSVVIEDTGSPYVLGGSFGVGSGSTDFVGLITPTGSGTSGTFPGVVDVITSLGQFLDVTASGTYASVGSTGRSTGTANFTNGSTAISTVIYIARHRRFFVLDVQTSTPYLLDVALQ